jgi:hypothetical protein
MLLRKLVKRSQKEFSKHTKKAQKEYSKHTKGVAKSSQKMCSQLHFWGAGAPA